MTLTLAERDRRYGAVRAEMAARGVDVLVVVGRDSSGERGNHRYLAGYGIVAAFSHTIVFGTDGEPVFFSGSSPAANIGVESGWVRDLRASRKPLPEIVEEVRRRRGSGNVGVVTNVSVPLYRALVDTVGADALVDAEPCFVGPRLVKSPEELDAVRRCARVADDVYAELRELVAPGISDFELYGELRRSIHAGGCEYSMDIIDTGDGSAAGGPRGRVLDEDSVVQIELTPAIEGYYTQLRVPFSARGDEWPDGWRELLVAWQAGYERAKAVVRPGVRASDIHAAAVAGVAGAGAEVGRRAGHGLGLEVDEFISIDPEDDTELVPGMVLVVHVPARGGGRQVMVGGTFLVTDAGHDELNSLAVLDGQLAGTLA